jgi:hypothetical protein
MDMAADISALQVASGSNLANYQEIVRDEKSANCRARWPLLAQTALTAWAQPQAVTTVATAIGQRSGAGGGGRPASAAARFDGVVRPLAAAAASAADGASAGAAATAATSARAALPAAVAPVAAERGVPVLMSVVTRGAAPSPEMRAAPRPSVRPAPGLAGSAAIPRTVQAAPRSGLDALFKRLDAPKQPSAAAPR